MLAEMMRSVRAQRPLVHCITNYVTANDCANLLLACGASPIMADAPEEAAEITAGCGALVINLGTPNAYRLQAMHLSGRAARERLLPVVFDPVGAAASDMRLKEALRIIEEARPSVIRGNASEIRALLGARGAGCGVDSADADDAAGGMSAVRLARKTGGVVVLTGAQDVVTDGRQVFRVMNGSPVMRFVTGAGCQLSALTGAYAAANPRDMFRAALAAVCAMGVCGERAERRMSAADGNAGFRNYLIDAMYNLTPEELEGEARYEED